MWRAGGEGPQTSVALLLLLLLFFLLLLLLFFLYRQMLLAQRRADACGISSIYLSSYTCIYAYMYARVCICVCVHICVCFFFGLYADKVQIVDKQIIETQQQPKQL